MEIRMEHAPFCLGDFEITFLLITLIAGADLGPEGFGSEVRDDASSFVLPRRQLALHSAVVPASRLKTLVAPLGAKAA